ncbi:type II secretion system F family protein [Coraliomargarita akajimensis]|uniref:General secretion pathway protein F n=1 Tax=Coraliomargarita akajimensis (strain DSM 45221 / IAM 15411 / JCM 23193 / KCTC 12865 / 04OKA010-24) TaxID=583355 RepID=D5EJ66_CORAD|nr:type II secretion system F family protein [Coraliomargarita akajimensis]ADE54465.1 Type II secretion system F domain protein [Coraliomargarita akajimensis DSM 45221]
MAKYKYTAIDQNGKQKTGTINAESTDEANSKLSAMGLMPTNVAPAGSSAPKAKKASDKTKKSKGKGAGLNFGKIIKPEELTTFTRQLATLLQAGLPLLRALEVMIRQERNLRFKAVLEQIADQVKSGNSFSDGLAQHPKVFDRLYINMIKAGEAGGVLDVVLSRLAGFMEKALKTKKKVKSAMVYPIVVVGVAVSIVVLLMVVVVPKFQSIFDDMLDGKALPAPTQLVINISNFVKGNFIITAILCVLAFVGFKFFLKTKIGSRGFNWFSINFPKVGDLVRKVNIARITRTFGTLLSSGVPILQSINITKDITGNAYFAGALGRIHDSVRDGETLAAPMERESIFPNMVTSMIDVGEETGELAEMLNRVADNYDEDVDNAVAGITSIIEPIMIVFLALVVGFIVIALFLPIVEIIKQLSG